MEYDLLVVKVFQREKLYIFKVERRKVKKGGKVEKGFEKDVSVEIVDGEEEKIF